MVVSLIRALLFALFAGAAVSATPQDPNDPLDWAQLESRFRAGEAAASQELISYGDASIKLLQKIMSDPKAGASQFVAANVLGDIGSPACVAPLLQGLEHPWFNVRRCAALALGRIGDPSVIPQLEKLAAEDPFQYVDPDSGEKSFLVRLDAESALKRLRGFEEILLEDASVLPQIRLELPKKKLAWPFKGGFKAQNLYNNYQQPTDHYVHAALDLLQPAGTQVRAVAAGTVASIATNYPDWTTHHFFLVEPEAGSGEAWCYTHVDPASYTFKVGDKIRAGEVLGEVVDFGLGDRDGVDHLHLHYVAFSELEDGSVKMHSLFDPLQRFAWKDQEDPTIHLPFRFSRDGQSELLPLGRGKPILSGKIDILAAISDKAFRQHTANWMVPVVTLEIHSKSADPWRKLVLDQRGPMTDDRQTSALYLPSQERMAFTEDLPRNPVAYVLRLTNTDGDGVIEADDEMHCWNTGMVLEDGKRRFPDGDYEIIVRAWDLAGNQAEAKMMVQVQND